MHNKQLACNCILALKFWVPPRPNQGSYYCRLSRENQAAFRKAATKAFFGFSASTPLESRPHDSNVMLLLISANVCDYRLVYDLIHFYTCLCPSFTKSSLENDTKYFCYYCLFLSRSDSGQTPKEKIELFTALYGSQKTLNDGFMSVKFVGKQRIFSTRRFVILIWILSNILSLAS